MAAPNIVNVSTIFGKSSYANLTTVYANVITNGATSGNVIKVNEITISNYTGSTVGCNVQVGRGSSLFFIVGNISVPASSALVVLAKDTTLYLEEGDYIQANATANITAHLVTSYEVIN
jgi:hypothetical protein